MKRHPVEKLTEYLMKPEEGKQPHFQNANMLNVIVTGGSSNNYFSIGGLRYDRSVQIDKWR
jgi:hypothetical protein